MIRRHGDSPACMNKDITYTISELSREFDITPRTIRFYEDQGLLTPARQGRNRVYSRADRTRLKLALRGKRLGLSLAEIKEILQMYGGANNAPQLEHFLKILDTRRKALAQQLEDIEVVLGEIDLLEEQAREQLANHRKG